MFGAFLIMVVSFISIPPVITGHNSFEIKNDNDTLKVSPWGMNAHLTFDSSSKYVEESCKSMSEAGVSIVRIDIYWWYGKMLMQQELCDRAVYYADKYGLEVLINFPQLPNRIDAAFLNEWANMIESYVIRYNGRNPVKIEGESQVRYPKVNYFEVLNEVELNYKKQSIDVNDLYKLIKKSSETLHKARYDSVKVVFPGISPFNEFIKSLLDHKENEKSLIDFVDIFNIHCYHKTTDDFIYAMNLWKDIRREYNCINKPFWITELGNSTWDVAGNMQAMNLVKQYILASAYNVERTFYYQFHTFGGNFFCDRNQREEYFGIISNDDNMPYASFWENDGACGKALSEGDALKKVNYNPQNGDYISVYTLTDRMCDKLQKKGLAIGGENIVINKVELIDQNANSINVWNGKISISNKRKRLLTLSPGLFNKVSSKSKLKVFIESSNSVYKWKGFDLSNSYVAYHHLSTLLNKGATQPSVYKDRSGMVVASWRSNKSFVYALWNDKSNVQIELNKRTAVRVTNINGKILRMKNNCLGVTNVPIFVESNEALIIDVNSINNRG